MHPQRFLVWGQFLFENEKGHTMTDCLLMSIGPLEAAICISMLPSGNN